MPPDLLTAATSSGLLPGNMGPQNTGIEAPVSDNSCWVDVEYELAAAFDAKNVAHFRFRLLDMESMMKERGCSAI
jgi:hypothetical protein